MTTIGSVTGRGATRSSKDSQPNRLRFNTLEDSINFAANIVKQGQDRFSTDSLNFCESYEQGKSEIVFTSTPNDDIQTSSIFLSNRKIRAFWFRFSGGHSYSIGSMVERGPEIKDGIGYDVLEDRVQGFCQREELRIAVGMIRVWLGYGVIRLFVEERLLSSFEVINVCLRPRHLAP